MRIALYHNLPSGGAKRSTYEAMQRLSARHEIDVYTLSSANHDFADLRALANRHIVFPFVPSPLFRSPFGRINQLGRVVDLLRLRLLERRIAHVIQANSYDVVYVQPCQYQNAPSLLTYLVKTPTVYYCHEPLRRLYEPMPVRPYDTAAAPRRAFLNRIDPLPWLYASLQRRTDFRNTQNANTILVNSRFNQANVQRIYNRLAHVSYHGVDIQKFYPLHRQRERTIFAVGSLTPLKGFDFLIESIALMPPTERAPLYIASNFQNEPEKDFLQALARSRDVELHLLGEVSDERLLDFYNEACAVAYTPVREPFGMVALEAMACEAPVVGVREGGLPETIAHEETGLLSQRETSQFAQSLRRLLGDSKLAATLGRQGRRTVEERWTWEQSSARLEEFLVSAVQGAAT